MNNTTTNAIFKYAIIIGLAIIAFIPLYVANGLFFPFITGKGFAFRIMVEVAFALWLILILREKGTSLPSSEKSVLPRLNTMTILVSIFAFLALVSDIFGLNPLRSIWSNFERMEGWIIIIHLWAYFLVLSSVIRTKENWQKFWNVIIIAGLIAGLYGLFQFFGWAETHQGSRVDASLGNSAYMAIYMLINAFIAAYLVSSNLSKKHLVWVYSILAAFFSFIMFQTATRGTILGWIAAILVSCAIYAVFGRKQKGQSNISRLVSLGIIILFILIGTTFWHYRQAPWIKNNAVLGRLATISLSDTKTQARGFIWPMAVKSIFENPKTAIIGIGQENFNYIFNSHYDPGMYAHEQWFDRAHSVFLDWLVAGGLLGLLSYLSLYLIALIYIYKTDITIAEKSVLTGLLVGYAIHNVFVFDNQTSYVMFFTFLAFVSSLRPGPISPWFKNYSKSVSEDSITVRDYILVPIVVIAFAITLYFINIRPLQANTRLIYSMQTCQNGSAQAFANALKLNQTIANQEIREQLFSCAANVIRNKQISEQKKVEFYNLARAEIDKQIAETPNDARIYIIGGSFLDSIGDLTNATPLLEKATLLSPNKQSILFELGYNYMGSNKATEALDIMEKAYFLAPQNPNARIAYATALINNNEDEKARTLFSDSPEIFQNPQIINVYVATKQFEKAIEAYKTMIKKTPDNPELYSSLASVYVSSGQSAKAIDILKVAETRFVQLKSQIEGFIKQIQEKK